MRQILTICMSAVVLVGCASPYGSFIKNAPASLNDTLAADTIKQLITLYPPASTHFEIGHPTTDGYGKALVKELRTKGYSVKEAEPTFIANRTQEATGGALSLRYVLDTPAGLYRLTVTVEQKSFTRAYLDQNSMIVKAGAWIQREQ